VQADLEVMRAALADKAAYFERDLVGFATPIMDTDPAALSGTVAAGGALQATVAAAYNVRYWNLDRLDQVSCILFIPSLARFLFRPFND
jgi:hypothetical protein